jgi:hypothetical protein
MKRKSKSMTTCYAKGHEGTRRKPKTGVNRLPFDPTTGPGSVPGRCVIGKNLKRSNAYNDLNDKTKITEN